MDKQHADILLSHLKYNFTLHQASYLRRILGASNSISPRSVMRSVVYSVLSTEAAKVYPEQYQNYAAARDLKLVTKVGNRFVVWSLLGPDRSDYYPLDELEDAVMLAEHWAQDPASME